MREQAEQLLRHSLQLSAAEVDALGHASYQSAARAGDPPDHVLVPVATLTPVLRWLAKHNELAAQARGEKRPSTSSSAELLAAVRARSQQPPSSSFRLAAHAAVVLCSVAFGALCYHLVAGQRSAAAPVHVESFWTEVAKDPEALASRLAVHAYALDQLSTAVEAKLKDAPDALSDQ